MAPRVQSRLSRSQRARPPPWASRRGLPLRTPTLPHVLRLLATRMLGQALLASPRKQRPPTRALWLHLQTWPFASARGLPLRAPTQLQVLRLLATRVLGQALLASPRKRRPPAQTLSLHLESWPLASPRGPPLRAPTRPQVLRLLATRVLSQALLASARKQRPPARALSLHLQSWPLAPPRGFPLRAPTRPQLLPLLATRMLGQALLASPRKRRPPARASS